MSKPTRLQQFSLFVFIVFLASCASPSKKSSDGSGSGDDLAENGSNRRSEKSNENNSGETDDNGKSDTRIEDKKLVDLTYSRSNNNDTRLSLKRRKAEGYVSKYSKADNLADLMFGMSAARLAGKGIAPSLSIAQKIMVLEVRKSIDRDLPDYAKVELVLSAIDSKKYELANYFVALLKKSKNDSYRAAAWNAEGIMLASEGSIPEAELSWSQALKQDSKFMAARLNLGFTAARYGDLNKAKDLLEPYVKNLAVAATLVSIYRMAGNKKADGLCEKIEEEAKGDPVLLINCALNAMDGQKDLGKASKMFKSILDRERKDPQIRKIAQDRLSRIRDEAAKSSAGKPSKKQEEEETD